MNILTSHDMIDNIERDFLHGYGDELFHSDPVVTNDEEVIKTRNMVHDIVKAVDKSYSIHDFRMVSIYACESEIPYSRPAAIRGRKTRSATL